MDFRDVLFGVVFISAYSFVFLSYAAVGNIIAGHKVQSGQDFLHPFARGSPHKKGQLFFPIYYLIFLLLTLFTLLHIMSFRSTFRSWIDKLIGSSESPQPVSSITSATSLDHCVTPSASSSDPTENKTPEVSKTASKTKLRKAKKKMDYQARKEKPPNVMRSSVVDPQFQVIPPLPRLSVREDTADKLTRVLSKLDTIELSDGERTPPSGSTPATPKTTPKSTPKGKRKNE